MTDLERTVQLIDDVVAHTDPKMKWTWGEGLFGFALCELDRYQKEEKYLSFLKQYCDYWVKQDPKVDSSDTSAPCLITYRMAQKTGDSSYRALTEKGLRYIKTSPRVLEDVPNHMGSSFNAHFFPPSIWVDSLMMFSVFPAIYGSENEDQELCLYAAKLPSIFSKYLQNPSGLFYHEYIVPKKKPYPEHDLFWGRGNGWVVAALPMLLARLDNTYQEKTAIQTIWSKTVHAMMACQNKDGSFNTLLHKKSYRELSATALYAYGIFQAANQGYLAKDSVEMVSGKKAAEAVFGAIRQNSKGRYEFPEISGPTCPLPPFPGLNYKLIPRKANWSYGLAALVLLAIEEAKFLS